MAEIEVTPEHKHALMEQFKTIMGQELKTRRS